MRGASLRDCARHHGRHGNLIADATATCRRRGQNRTSYQTPSQRCPGPRNSRHSGDFHRHNRRTRRGARRSCIPRPEWSNETYIFGYPPISTLDTPYLLVQRGAVVNPAVKSQQDEHFFLYSANARPRNSGGPIVAQDGRVVGLVTHDLPDGDIAPTVRPPEVFSGAHPIGHVLGISFEPLFPFG